MEIANIMVMNAALKVALVSLIAVLIITWTLFQDIARVAAIVASQKPTNRQWKIAFHLILVQLSVCQPIGFPEKNVAVDQL